MRTQVTFPSSFLFRLRSSPTCNIEVGPPLRSLLGDSRSVSPVGPFFMAVQSGYLLPYA